MPFAYYDRLRPPQQAIYRQSDAVVRIDLPAPDALRSFVDAIATALVEDNRRAAEAASQYLCRGILAMLDAPPVAVSVLSVRPMLQDSELHGLYTRDEKTTPRIQVWMRTAKHKRVVAFRTYLRTLLHELGHHLDYVHLKLADSYHTEGFFKRESSLFYQLVPPAAPKA